MNDNPFINDQNPYSENVAEQVQDFQKNMDVLTGFYRKATVMMAADRIMQELGEIDKPDPPKLLNPRRIHDLLMRFTRYIAGRIVPGNRKKNIGDPIVIDILPTDVIEIEEKGV